MLKKLWQGWQSRRQKEIERETDFENDSSDVAEIEQYIKEHPEAMAQSAAFFAAANEAREKAGISNDEGEVFFTCPNCGATCRSSFIWYHGSLHGGVGCEQCKIMLMV